MGLSAEIVQLRFFEPRIPRDPDTELSIAADISMLDKITQWAVAQKFACLHESRPLSPKTRMMLMEAMDTLEL